MSNYIVMVDRDKAGIFQNTYTSLQEMGKTDKNIRDAINSVLKKNLSPGMIMIVPVEYVCKSSFGVGEHMELTYGEVFGLKIGFGADDWTFFNDVEEAELWRMLRKLHKETDNVFKLTTRLLI